MTTKKSKGSMDYKESAQEFEMRVLGRVLTFGDSVGALRELNGLTQTALAKKIGVSRQYLCDIEKGRRLGTPALAVRIAKAIHHPPNDLIKLSIEDQLRESGLNLKVTLTAA